MKCIELIIETFQLLVYTPPGWLFISILWGGCDLVKLMT